MTIDLDELDSLAKVQAAEASGILEKLLLLPVEFGGKDIPQNVVYVPVDVLNAKKRVDAEVSTLLGKGVISKYSATPEYAGKSLVPIRIRIKAWHPEKGKKVFETIEVWGCHRRTMTQEQLRLMLRGGILRYACDLDITHWTKKLLHEAINPLDYSHEVNDPVVQGALQDL